MKKRYIFLLLLGMGPLSGMDFFKKKEEAPRGHPRTSSSTPPKTIKKGRSSEEMRSRRALSNLSKSPSNSNVSLLSKSAPAPIEEKSSLTTRIKDQDNELLKKLRAEDEAVQASRKRTLSNANREGLSLQERFEDSLRSNDDELWPMYLELDRERLQGLSDPTESIVREKETIARHMELNQTLQLLHERLKGVEGRENDVAELLKALNNDFEGMKATIEKQDKQLTGLCKLLTRAIKLVVKEQAGNETNPVEDMISERNNLVTTMNTFLQLLSGDPSVAQPS